MKKLSFSTFSSSHRTTTHFCHQQQQRQEMFFLNSNVLQCFMCLLLLWPLIIDSFPSTSLTDFNRYERDTSGAVFSKGEELDLVIQNGNEYLEFEICCTNDNGCRDETFTFCYPTSSPTQTGSSYATSVECNEPNTCAYNINFNGIEQSSNKRQVSLFSKKFDAPSKCFIGKINSTDVYAYYGTTELAKVDAAGCQFEIDSEKRFVIKIPQLGSHVSVTAKNAEKYVEPTPPPTSTSSPTETTKEVSSPQTKKKEKESGMSNAVKYTIFGVGALLLILVIGGAGFAIYWFCCKSKKSSKPAAPVVTVVQTEKQPDTTPVPTPAPKGKPKASKKKTAKTEESKIDTRADPTPSNLLSSVAEPPAPTASKEPAAPSKPDRKHPVLTPYRQPSTDLVQHYSQPKTPPHALPAATATMTDLLGRAGQRGFRGRKFNDTFDKIRKPQYENIFDAMVRQKWISDDQALNVKEKYRREISEDEIRLYSLPIGDMYPKLNEMIDEAAYYHKPHDENAKCELIDNQFHTYFVSHYATVVHFARFFKVKETDTLTAYSIPLLLGIAMDRAQTEAVRRRALVEMTLKGIQLTKVNTEQQCLKMPYPMNVMCLSFQLDPYLLENEHRLHTFSSPNNSECTRSDASTKKTAGQSIVTDEGNRRRGRGKKTGGGQSTVADEGNRRRRGGGKKSSSSSSKAGGTKTSVSKEMAVVEKKKKKNGKRKL